MLGIIISENIYRLYSVVVKMLLTDTPHIKEFELCK